MIVLLSNETLAIDRKVHYTLPKRFILLKIKHAHMCRNDKSWPKTYVC